MDSILINLLALDDRSKAYGCGLNPALRDAIEKDARYPAHAASPAPQSPVDPAMLPDNVTLLKGRRDAARRKTA